MNWFVLFVRSGSEERVAALLKGSLDTDVYLPFVPKKAYPRIEKGTVIKQMKLCFPGYIFVQSDNGVVELIRDVCPMVSLIKEAYHFLTYGADKQDMAMRGHEKAHMMQLMNADFCMDGSLGFLVGDRVQIISGPLVGLESRIKKVNKNKRTAVVELLLMGQARETTLMLEFMEKVQNI